ncbi:uncharacterized protein LOC132197258 isoform X2 [Neocloeon triangulifer]|uniref:uncharacterized protein LOC132197258 isoform X2 n=1 Tax=Neocloeon triangulifer TaxID=2078957 RepID=UPI00286EE180|nr:uncharacterized protein LOC132197258 isoform X2 [Neocloeon triangulifer]
MVEPIDPENWQAEAKREQCEFYTKVGHKVTWRGVPSETKHSLQLMIAEHMFHSELTDEQEDLSDLGLSRTEAITKYFPEQFVYINIIYVTAKWKKSTWGEIVFRVEGGGQTKFIDSRYRVYSDWGSYLTGNRMAPCQMCYPPNGRYTLAPTGMEVLLEIGWSPNSSRKNRILATCKLIAYLALFFGLILDAVNAFLPDITILFIVGSSISIVALIYLVVLAVVNFVEALKYS